MEFSQCVHKESLARLAKFYENMSAHGAEVKGKASGGYVSGGTAATGGLAALNEYADSVYSSAKEGLIRKIAKDMNDILGIKGNKRLNADGDISEIVKQMNDILPNPRKRRGIRSNKDGATKYTAVHKDLCKALAESINKNYGSGIIDLGQSDNALCNSVSEVIHSLITGMHSEFSTIAADVGQVIRNLTVMMEFLKRSHEKLKSVVLASNDANITSQADVIDKFYEKLVKETNRQLAVLNNLMGGVVSPVGNDFLQVLRETEDFKGFVEDIKGTLGSEEFGNKLGYLLAGVNNVAQTAKMVDKALKEIGMSVKDYKKTTGIENLRDEIYAIMSKADKMTADELIKFMKAADVLYRNDMQHPEIVEYLDKQKVSGGGDCPACGSVSGGTGCGCGAGGDVSGGYRGGVANDVGFEGIFERKESFVNDKYKQLDKVRKLIFTDFEKQLLTIYQRIISCVQQLGPKIGNEIPVSDELMKFVRAFNQVDGANRTNIASALSGYNKSGMAKDVRNSFLSSLEVVDITIDPLVSKHNLFRELRQEINMMMKLVDTFSTKFVETLTTPPSFVNSSGQTSGGEIGGEIGGVIVNSEPPVGMVERYASFGKAQFQLYYFSRIASIKRSMARASTEKKVGDDQYEKLVGQATSRLINEQATKLKANLESLNFWNKKPADFVDKREFDEKLPPSSPGRALYFYVNTVSGYEPFGCTVDNYYQGNVTGRTTGLENVTSADLTAIGDNIAGVNAGNFIALWNFTQGAAARTPPAAQITATAGSMFRPWNANIGTLLGAPFTTFESGPGVTPSAFANKDDENTLLGKRYKAANKIVDIIKDYENRAFNAKKEMIEVAENIDLYLSSFTDSILTKPESILSLAKILQRVSVVRKMYTDVSGDTLARVFEAFPADILNGALAGANTGAAAAAVTGGYRYPGQTLDLAAVPGAAVGEYKNQDHYYDYVSQVAATTSAVGNHKLALDLSDIFDETKENRLTTLYKNIEKSVLGVRALENLLLAFVQVGNEQTNKTFLTHGKVLKSLFNYVTVSAISRHYVSGATGAANENLELKTVGPAPAVANSAYVAEAKLQQKIATFDLYGPLKMALSVTLHDSIHERTGSNCSYEDDFAATDRLLELVSKAICSKVLTVLGLYQIYNKPSTGYMSFGAIRSIIGGGEVARPKIIPEAIDLYVRLPLLAEWFRDILVGKSDKSTIISSGSYMLAMVPDVTNLWGEFLRTIFIRAELTTEGNYGDDDINTIITEINKIFGSYKSKNNADTVLSACEGLISEINMRYSIAKKTDVDKYWDRANKHRLDVEDFDSRKDDDYVDFDLLDSHNGVKVKSAPSDKYMDVSLITAAKESSWSTDTFDLVRKLHARMFNKFNADFKDSVERLSANDKDSREGSFDVFKFTFDGVIRQYKEELKIANTEEERYKIARKAISDVGKMSDVNPDRVIMLHEFVIAPLTNLMGIYNTMRNVLESFTWMTSDALKHVLTYLDTISDVEHELIGVRAGVANTTKLQAPAVATLNSSGLFNRVLENALTYYHPQAAPFLMNLLINEGDAADHGVAGATTVFGIPDNNDFATKIPEKSLLLSTKKLFKTHMQMFANLKSSLGDRVQINFTNKSYPTISFGGLISDCEAVLNNVKKALIYLRPTIPQHIIRRYEESKNVGSVYWLEENLFSELFHNERRHKKFFTGPAVISVAGGAPAARQAIVEYYNAASGPTGGFELHPSVYTLNEVLKDSFKVVTQRNNNDGLRGKELCEQGLMELCAWGFDKTLRTEVNNESKTDFPFNVVDLVDDLDPAIGKVRRLLADKALQSQVADLNKRLGRFESNDVDKDIYSKVYGFFSLFANLTTNPAVPLNQVRILADSNPNIGAPKTLLNMLSDALRLFCSHRLVGDLTAAGIGAALRDKIGSPAFGMQIVPFPWDGNNNAAIAVANQSAGFAARPGANPPITPGVDFDTLKAQVAAAAAAGANIPNIVLLSNQIAAPTPAQVRTAGNEVGQYIRDQIRELNRVFNEIISKFDIMLIGDDKYRRFVYDVLGAPNMTVILTEITNILDRLRFMIGYHHLKQITTYNVVADTVNTGIRLAAANTYSENMLFCRRFSVYLGESFSSLYLSRNNNTVISPALSSILTLTRGEHTEKATIAEISNNAANTQAMRSVSPEWLDGAATDQNPSDDETVAGAMGNAADIVEYLIKYIRLVRLRAANRNPAIGGWGAADTAALALAVAVYTRDIVNTNIGVAVPLYNIAAPAALGGLGGNHALLFDPATPSSTHLLYSYLVWLTSMADQLIPACHDVIESAIATRMLVPTIPGGGFAAASILTIGFATGAVDARRVAFDAEQGVRAHANARAVWAAIAGQSPITFTEIMAAVEDWSPGNLQVEIWQYRSSVIGDAFAWLAANPNDLFDSTSTYTRACTTAGNAASVAGALGASITVALHINLINAGNSPTLGTAVNAGNSINATFAAITNVADPGYISQQLNSASLVYNTAWGVGNVYLLSFPDKGMTSLMTAGNQLVDVSIGQHVNAVNAILTIPAPGSTLLAYNTAVTTRQGAALGSEADGYNVQAADQTRIEAWLRKMVVKYIGNTDVSFLKESMNIIMRDIYGADLSTNARNTEPRLSGFNSAFVINRINLYDSWSAKGPLSNEKQTTELSIFGSRGLLVQFNQLLAAYIGTFVEPGTKKFYAPLAEGLMNSKISDSITSGNAIADINIADVTHVGIPPEGTIVFASIARAVRTLLYKRLENNKENLHATNSLLEVAGFMRENMKGNLPHFAKLFTQLADIAVMYKKVLLDNPVMKYNRAAPAAPITFSHQGVENSEKLLSKCQKKYIDPNLPSSESELVRYYRILLDNLEIACSSVVRCISHVYKELNDVPIYGETYSGSIMELKQRTGKYPLTLPSAVQTMLHHTCYNTGAGLPAARHGSEAFKLLFMTRRLLTENPGNNVSGGAISTLDLMPGIIETINNYNTINDERSKLPKALIESSIKSNITLVNILLDLKVRGSWILDPNSNGGGIFRREIYGSAMELDLDRSNHTGAINGFNFLAAADQLNIRSRDAFKNYAKARGLAPTNKNQSIYVLRDASATYKMKIPTGANANNVSELVRANVSINRFAAGPPPPAQVFNTLTGFPANEAGLNLPSSGGGTTDAVLLRPGGDPACGNLVPYSDVIGYPTSLVSYSFGSADNLSNLITLVESTDIDYNKRQLLRMFTDTKMGYDERSKARFYNILDLNVVPINIHALQQSVPLINLLNYGHTFDKFVIERLNIMDYDNRNSDDIFAEDESRVTNVKSAFARMLIHPYAATSYDHFSTWHTRIAVGATGNDIPMDRPKYYSDQIFNKVCLQSLNPSDVKNPGGPGYVMEHTRYYSEGLHDLLTAKSGRNARIAVLAYNERGPAGAVALTTLKKEHRDKLQKFNTELWNIGINPAAANDLTDFSNAGGYTAPVGNAITTAFLDAFVTEFRAKIRGGPFARLDDKIRSTLEKAIRDYVAFARTFVGVTQAGATYESNDGRHAFVQVAGPRVPHENEIITTASLARTIWIYLAEILYDFGATSRMPISVNNLYYIKTGDEVKSVPLRNHGALISGVQGKMRYNTRLVRNLTWFSQLHRFMLWSIKDSLVKNTQPVVSDAGVIDPTLIDFRGYQSYDKKDYYL